MKTFPNAQAYLFDLDGTLAASEALKGRALAQTCASYGVTVDHFLYADVMGRDWLSVTEHFFRYCNITPDASEFNGRFRDIYVQLIENYASSVEGAKEFIHYSRLIGIRVGLVSSADSWMGEKILAKIGLEDEFELVISKEHVSRHKPDPEAYLLALKRLGLNAQDVLVFEDSAAGLNAAVTAGCRCVAVRHNFNSRHDFSAAVLEIQDFTTAVTRTDRI